MPRRKRPPIENIPIEMGEPEIPANIEIEVAENTSKPPSFRDRIMGTFEKDPLPKQPSRGSRGGKANEKNELIASAMPVVFSAFIVTMSRTLVGDPYKPMCPTKEECEAVLKPFFSIVARRVKISLTASQDALDATACLVATMTYGTRALITYEIINKEKRDHDRQGVSGTPDKNNGTDRGETSHSSGYASTSDSNSIDPNTEDKLFSSLFRRDIEGRKQMGLLDRGL